MILLTVQGQTYNLDYLVKFVTHTGQRDIGGTGVTEPEPVFEPFRYVELIFADGVHVTLDDVQTEAFLTYMRRRSFTIDLDRVEEAAIGHVVVHDTVEGGDIILQTAEEADAATRPVELDFRLPTGERLDY